jgi:SAM-dependent methyltransferase
MAKASVHPRPASQGVAVRSPSLCLLVCNACGGSLAQATTDTLRCALCHKAVRVYGGIVDFVAGGSSTQLDNIDYDAFYSINADHSTNLYHMIRSSAGTLWPSSFGDTLEIGCGTGGFSMALLSNMPMTEVVLTDVSVKMLQICKNRLEQPPGSHKNSVTYATYSGTEGCFRPGAFDTCCGTSVVHHIIDVPRLLSHVHRLLKVGGRAFFMEPNWLFHMALVRTLADIVANHLPRAGMPDLDITLILNWVAEVNCSMANSGDIEVLAEREDKHFFIAKSFISMAEAAGFSRTTALSCGPDPTGVGALGVYMAQCGITPGTMELLRSLWPDAHREYFGALHERDQSPCYLFWLEKGLRSGTPRRRVVAKPDTDAGPNAGTAPWLWLTLALRRREDGMDLVVEGWCVAQAAVRALQIDICGVRRRLPIWRPRPDVNAAVNAEGTFPPLHALCCGIEGTVHLDAAGAVDSAVPVSVSVLPHEGRAFSERTLSLILDGAAVLLN